MVSEINLNMATNAKDLKVDIVISAEILKSDMNDLKSELKLDIVTNADELKSDIASKIETSHNVLMTCIGTFEVQMNKVETLTSSVPFLVQTDNSKISENK